VDVYLLKAERNVEQQIFCLFLPPSPGIHYSDIFDHNKAHELPSNY